MCQGNWNMPDNLPTRKTLTRLFNIDWDFVILQLIPLCFLLSSEIVWLLFLLFLTQFWEAHIIRRSKTDGEDNKPLSDNQPMVPSFLFVSYTKPFLSAAQGILNFHAKNSYRTPMPNAYYPLRPYLSVGSDSCGYERDLNLGILHSGCAFSLPDTREVWGLLLCVVGQCLSISADQIPPARLAGKYRHFRSMQLPVSQLQLWPSPASQVPLCKDFTEVTPAPAGSSAQCGYHGNIRRNLTGCSQVLGYGKGQ